MAHVLVVEPDIHLARAYVGALQHAGHQVQAAGSAQMAIHAADTQTPDVVLLELQLPAHGGIEFLYEFRSYPEWGAVPVVINSYTPPHVLASVADTLRDELGVHAVLYKPQTSLDVVLRTVAACLKGAA